MIRLTAPACLRREPCPYLAGQTMRLKYFFAQDVSGGELDGLLALGWRKFGWYYFKPSCPSCRECVPIRIPVSMFRPSKSQRRVLRRAEGISVYFRDLEYRDEIFEIHCDHSQNRFGKKESLEAFRRSFYYPSCPAFQAEYYLDGRLVAVDFIDRSSDALSSVYCVFRTAYGRYRPGTLSVLREIEYTRELGLRYYYLGYYIAGTQRMAYKGLFRPHERMDWETGEWRYNIAQRPFDSSHFDRAQCRQDKR